MIIKGDIDEIRFRNDDNGYSVLVLDVEGEPVIASGNFPPVFEGQSVSVEGEYVIHKKYGKQFKVNKAELNGPGGQDGIIRYLGSGIIKGIGPALALKIVMRFRDKTFDIIEFHPDRLAEINGISKNKAADIHEGYTKIKEMQSSVMALQDYGITLNMALKIYKVYGTGTVAAVKSNPYSLIEDVDGIGFKTADKIAFNAGIEKDSDFRIRAGIIYTLKENSRKEGNTCLPCEILLSEAAQLLEASQGVVESNADRLVIERRLKEVVQNETLMYMLPTLYHTEKNAAVLTYRLINSALSEKHDVRGDITEFEKVNNIEFHESQRLAIEHAVNDGVTVITGGPGTGKTTIIKCILDIFDKLKKTAVLMAPTGRAAKRMSESTGRDASTIHRALGLGRENDFQREVQKLSGDAVIIDEFSMVDIYLYESVLKRLPEDTKLIAVGDADQLPSVGAGNVLKDLMNIDAVSVNRLDKIFRQSENSGIVKNAHMINHGEIPDLKDRKSDFFFVNTKSTDETAAKALEMAATRIPKYLGVEPQKVQVLCPLKNGVAGTISLNRALQGQLNNNGGAFLEDEIYKYSAGDKVMHTVNNYDLEWELSGIFSVTQGAGVFNGDMGMIESVNKETSEISVMFEDGRRTTYDRTILSQLMLSYAITVHKSQGSEFDAVVIPLSPGSPAILTRNLLYTAVTRAKNMVVIIGEEYLIKKMIKNDYVALRYSMLRDFYDKTLSDSALLFSE